MPTHLVFIGGAAAAHRRCRFLGRPQQHHLAAFGGAQAGGERSAAGRLAAPGPARSSSSAAAGFGGFAFEEDGRGGACADDPHRFVGGTAASPSRSTSRAASIRVVPASLAPIHIDSSTT